MQLLNLKEKLVNRNYPEELVDTKFELAKQKNRRSLIFGNRNRNKGQKKVRCIFTHNKVNPPLHMWIRQSKKLLARNDEAKEIGAKIQIGSRQPRNLLRIVGGYKDGKGVPKTPEDAGCFKCKKCRVSCPILNETKTFKSTNTGKVYKVKQHLECNSNWLIYLCSCKNCRGQYVGKSKTLLR